MPLNPAVLTGAARSERRFRLGLAAGLAGEEMPGLAAAAGDGRTKVTTVRSPWLHRRCPACGHSFRAGDRVRVTAGGVAVHDMPDLCAPDGAATPAAGPGADADAEAFFAAVARGCPLPEGVPVLRLSAGHALLAAPAPGLPRHACRVCGHTFRPQEQVVVCPYSPAAPRCPVAVHRDVLRQLFCWDDWYRLNPDPQGRPCLAMA